MRKNIIAPAAAFIAGIIGMVLRNVQVNTIFDASNGLALRGAPVSNALLALSLAVVLGAAAFALVSKKSAVTIEPLRAFPVGGSVELAVITITGAVIALSSAVNYVMDADESIVFKGAFALLGVLTGVYLILYALGSVRGEKAKPGVLSVIPTLFAALWLVVTYKDNNTNPVLLEYCYRCLAAAASTAAFYYAAGYDYGKVTYLRTVVTHLLAIYFCMVTALDMINIALSVCCVAIAVLMAVRLAQFLSGRNEKTEEEEAEEEKTETEEPKMEESAE